MNCDHYKMLNHGLNHGLFLLLVKFFERKYILNLIADSGLKPRMLYCPNVSTTPLREWVFRQCLPLSFRGRSQTTFTRGGG